MHGHKRLILGHIIDYCNMNFIIILAEALGVARETQQQYRITRTDAPMDVSFLYSNVPLNSLQILGVRRHSVQL